MLELPLNLSTLLVGTFAAWQLTVLLHYDRGPFRMLIHARRLMTSVGLERFVSCFYCMCVWMSLAVVLIIYPLSWLTPILALAVGGAVSLIELQIGWVTMNRGVAGSRELAAAQSVQTSPAASSVASEAAARPPGEAVLSGK